MKNLSELQRMKASYNDMADLADEVEQGLFLPKRFRSAPFTMEKRTRYVAYLQREMKYLAGRIETIEKAAVQTQPAASSVSS